MINPFFANLFFITATALMFMGVFATVLLVRVIKLAHTLDDILESIRRTTEKVETVSGDFLDKVQVQSENVSGLLSTALGFLGIKNKSKTKKVAAAKKKTK